MTIAEILRLLLDGLKAVGGISEQAHNAARAAVDEHDETEPARPTFSDVEQAQLDQLLEKQAAAKGPDVPAEADTAEAKQAGPPPVPTPGGGFNQASGI